jgi:hypothetical protein
MEVVEQAPADDRLRVWIEGEDINGKKISKGVLLPLGARRPRCSVSMPWPEPDGVG